MADRRRGRPRDRRQGHIRRRDRPRLDDRGRIGGGGGGAGAVRGGDDDRERGAGIAGNRRVARPGRPVRLAVPTSAVAQLPGVAERRRRRTGPGARRGGQLLADRRRGRPRDRRQGHIRRRSYGRVGAAAEVVDCAGLELDGEAAGCGVAGRVCRGVVAEDLRPASAGCVVEGGDRGADDPDRELVSGGEGLGDAGGERDRVAAVVDSEDRPGAGRGDGDEVAGVVVGAAGDPGADSDRVRAAVGLDGHVRLGVGPVAGGVPVVPGVLRGRRGGGVAGDLHRREAGRPDQRPVRARPAVGPVEVIQHRSHGPWGRIDLPGIAVRRRVPGRVCRLNHECVAPERE